MTVQAAVPTIRITENSPHRPRSEPAGHSTSIAFHDRAQVSSRAPGAAGGIYHTRSITRESFDRRNPGPLDGADIEYSNPDVEEGDNWRENNQVKQKQIFRGTTLLWYVLLVLRKISDILSTCR